MEQVVVEAFVTCWQWLCPLIKHITTIITGLNLPCQKKCFVGPAGPGQMRLCISNLNLLLGSRKGLAHLHISGLDQGLGSSERTLETAYVRWYL